MGQKRAAFHVRIVHPRNSLFLHELQNLNMTFYMSVCVQTSPSCARDDLTEHVIQVLV